MPEESEFALDYEELDDFPQDGEDEEEAASLTVEGEVTVLDHYTPPPPDVLTQRYNPARVKVTRKVGRRSKLNRKFIKQVEELLLLGNYDEVVCDIVGVSRNSFYRWLRLGEDIEQEFEELDETSEYDWDFDKPEERKKALAVLGRDERDVLFYDFFQTVKKARAKAEGRLVTIVQAGANNDPYLAMKLLESRYSHRYGKKKMEITGADGGDIKISNSGGDMGQDEMAAAEIARLMEKAKLRQLQSGGDNRE